MRRAALLAALGTLAVCGTAQAHGSHLAIAKARTAVAAKAQRDAIIDGGTGGTATDCHHLTRSSVECWAHEYDIRTQWVDGPADLNYPITVTLTHRRLKFDSTFV